MARHLVRHRPRRRRHGPARLWPQPPPVRRARLAGDVLRHGHRAFGDGRDGLRVRIDAVARRAARRVGDARDWTIGPLRVESGRDWTTTQPTAGCRRFREETCGSWKSAPLNGKPPYPVDPGASPSMNSTLVIHPG